MLSDIANILSFGYHSIRLPNGESLHSDTKRKPSENITLVLVTRILTGAFVIRLDLDRLWHFRNRLTAVLNHYSRVVQV